MRGFEQHGVVLSGESGDHAIGACPFCGRDKKFYINKAELVWDCKVCGRSGNFEAFLANTMEQYQTMFKGEVVDKLAESRNLRPQTFRAWGVGWAGVFYAVPSTGNAARHTSDIRRYMPGKKSMSTTGGHASFIVPQVLLGSPRVWLCEGEWDGMAMYECLRRNGVHEDVYASPGALTFPPRLVGLFQGKEVVVVYDNDDPGRQGEAKVGKMLSGIAKSVRYVHWETNLPTGYDLRDFYKEHGRDALRLIESHIEGKPRLETQSDATPTPDKELSSSVSAGAVSISPEEVYAKYRKWLYIETTSAIEVMFGAVIANRIGGDPLWLFIVAPPGGMKSELIMSIANAEEVMVVNHLTPHALISGASFAGGGDPSLIPKLNGKVLAIKDFTTILSMNSLARDDIFSTLRDIYDGSTEKRFGNGIVRRYEARFGILAGVTPAVETLSSANVTLGERFLKYKLPKCGTDTRVIERALANIGVDDNMRKELAAIGKLVLDQKFGAPPALSQELVRRIVELAQWSASLRGVVQREKYTGLVNFKPMSEVGTRIAKQLCKLAMGVSLFKREEQISEATYATIVKVAQDTVPDRVEEIVKQLFIKGYRSHTTKELAQSAHFPEDTTRYILEDLSLLGITSKIPGASGGWALSETIYNRMTYLGLYKEEVIA